MSGGDRGLRRGGADVRIHMGLEALEVLVEHVDQALGRLRRTPPCPARSSPDTRMCGSTPGTEVGTAKPK